MRMFLLLLAALSLSLGSHARAEATDSLGHFHQDRIVLHNLREDLVALNNLTLEALDPEEATQRYRLQIGLEQPQCYLEGSNGRVRAVLIATFIYEDGSSSRQILKPFSQSDNNHANQDVTVKADVRRLPLEVRFGVEGQCRNKSERL